MFTFLWKVGSCSWIHWNGSVLAFASEIKALLSAYRLATWGTYQTLKKRVYLSCNVGGLG